MRRINKIRLHRTRIRICAAVLVLCVLLSGCWEEPLPEDLSNGITGSAELPSPDDSADSTETESGGVTLPEILTLPFAESQTLDPVTCADGIQQTVGALLYEGLYRLDEALEPQPLLCTGGSYDPAALTWTFSLRTDVTFSDGSSLTAADVVSTLTRAQTSERYGARFTDVASITAEGSTVQIVLTRGNARFHALLDIPIVKAGTEENLSPIGTGPYVYQDIAGNSYLEVNPNWWQGGGQPVEQIRLQDAHNRDTALYQFTSHTVQLITTDLTGTELVSASSGITFHDADTTVLQYLGYNTSGVFANAALRKALALGVNRENLTEVYLAGHAVPAQFPYSPVSALYPADLETAYSYSDFQAAMTAAGYATGIQSQTVILLVNEENSFKTACAGEIARTLSAFDLQVEVQALPWADYVAALEAGNFDLYYGEVRLTADWNLLPLLGTGGALNYGGFADAALDSLLYASLTANDSQSVRSVCSWLKEQAPIIPLCFKRVSVLTQSGVFDGLAPTVTNPFGTLANLTVHLQVEMSTGET